YQQTAADSGNPDPTTYAIGSNLSITPFIHGLVGYWPLNEGSGSTAYDLSGWGNDGTLFDTTSSESNFGPTWTTLGCLSGGSCLGFDGIGDSVNLNYEPAFSTTSLSLSSWVTIGNNDYDAEIFNNNQLFVRVDPQAEAIYRISAFIKLSDSSVEPRASCASNEPTTTWEFIAAVWNGATLYCYRDGVLEGYSSRSGSLTTTTATAQIGAGELTAGGHNWYGHISDLGLHNTALTSAQVQAIYNAEKPQ
ncbi:MAG: LamG domain-containing protein, partial [Patescibacteria group bacterium]|nr:LamG domain-containing protein [Patescibacteria group bacterium]